MQTKEITKLLGISREKIKYYKKKGVFTPENPVENGKTEYTERDFENLKRLVVLTKSGLSCDDIKKIQTGALSLMDALAEKQRVFAEEISRMTASIELSAILLERSVEYKTLASDELLDLISEREQAGRVYIDADEGYFSLSLVRGINCPYCGKRSTIDLSDYIYDESGEEDNGMGPDMVYSFDTEDCCCCPYCDKTFRVEGWIREYPIGAYDSESIDVFKEDEDNDK